MCGHVGVVGDIDHKAETSFKQLLIVDQLRGAHSTGVLSIGKQTGNVTIAKQVGDPGELMNDRRFDQLMAGSHRLLLGHNRFATQGKVNKANSHPFEFDNIIGAHNGTLNQRYKLVDNNKFDVDSMSFFNHVDKHGVEDAIKKIQGAWAFIWWDKIESTINFLRNKERPLFLAVTKDNKQMYWASEDWMLSGVLDRNGVAHNDIVLLDEDHWMSICVEKGGALGKPHLRKVEAEKQFTAQTATTHGAGAGRTGTTDLTVLAKAIKEHNKKKKQVATVTDIKSLTKVPDMPEGVLGSRDVLFEVLPHKMDPRGGRYYALENPLDPNVNFRMYVNTKEFERFAPGDMIQSDVSAYICDEGGYFKVHAGLASVVVTDEYRYVDHRGVAITKEEYERKYDYCAWCSSDIDADKDNRLMANGDCLCPDCQTKAEVKEFLTHA